SSVLCGLSANLTTLIIARVIQGLAGGGLLAKAQAILFETFPKNEQAQAQGLFGAIVIAGPAIGPTLGGYLTDTVGWRWIFFINIPVGIAAVLMCLTFLPADSASHKSKAGVDWIAIGLLAAGLGFLQTMLEEGQEDDWFQSRFIIACFVIGVVSLVLFVWRELVVEHPVVDLRVLRYRSLWSGSILSVTVGMALYGTLFAVPIFAQVVLRYTSNQVGWMLFPGALASAFTMPIAAKLVNKYDARALLVVGSIILIFALSKLTALSPLTSGDDLAMDLVIRSFGSVLIFLPLNMATLGPIPKEDVGKASGFFSLTRQLGGSTGVALLSVLLDQRQAFHRTVLVEKVATWDPRTLERVGAFTQ